MAYFGCRKFKLKTFLHSFSFPISDSKFDFSTKAFRLTPLITPRVRSGRLWAGTMFMEDPKCPGDIPLHRGRLYALREGRELSAALEPVSLSNGLDWSEDGRTFYYVDSKEDCVAAFDCDPATGALSDRRVAFDARANGVAGILDGMAIDCRGNLWIALFFGEKVRN